MFALRTVVELRFDHAQSEVAPGAYTPRRGDRVAVAEEAAQPQEEPLAGMAVLLEGEGRRFGGGVQPMRAHLLLQEHHNQPAHPPGENPPAGLQRHAEGRPRKVQRGRRDLPGVCRWR